MKDDKIKEQEYFMLKKYTPIKGVILYLIIQFIICMPIINALQLWEEDKRLRNMSKDELYKKIHEKEFWEGTFYNYEKVKIQKEKVKA